MSREDELLEEKRRLTEQLRRIDEACDVARHDAPADPRVEYLPTREEDGVLRVQVQGDWWPEDQAVELTRAALHRCDEMLEEVGLL